MGSIPQVCVKYFCTYFGTQFLNHWIELLHLIFPNSSIECRYNNDFYYLFIAYRYYIYNEFSLWALISYYIGILLVTINFFSSIMLVYRYNKFTNHVGIPNYNYYLLLLQLFSNNVIIQPRQSTRQRNSC